MLLRVLIASPSQPLAQSLSASLRNVPEAMVAGLTESPAGTLVAARRLNFEVLILDAALPEALSVWTQLRGEYPSLQVIVLADTPQQLEGWRAVGVPAVIAKGAPTQQLRNVLMGVIA